MHPCFGYLGCYFRMHRAIVLTGDIIDNVYSNVDAEEEERKQLEEVL